MPISSSISAPTGCGITDFVSKRAKSTGKNIVLICSHKELKQQWEKHLPNAEMITCRSFIHRVFKEEELIIVTEMMPIMFRMLLNNGLADMRNEVWLVNSVYPI